MILHDSHSSAYRAPIGPVKAGHSLTVRLFCDESDTVSLRTWNGSEGVTPMTAVKPHLFEATVTMPTEPTLLWYDFIIQKGEETLRYGNARNEQGGVGDFFYGMPRSYQVTVYAADYQTPDYLREGVIYQIFPDRFAKTASKPTAARKRDIEAAHPEATFHEDWNEAPELNIDPNGNDNQALDFFGGTLAGITEKLDYLQSLGVSVLYLNPVVRARSNHRYDTGDYEQVDPILGTNAGYEQLCKAAAQRGMKVLNDGVFSHTGADSKYFNRFGHYSTVGAYQSSDSPYAAWYHFDSFPNRYRSWWGFYTLPAVNKENPDYRRYLLDADKGVLPLWMKRGACGWRLDVADELPMELLRGMRKAVKRQDPNGALLGEVWEDASNKISYGAMRSYVLGDTLDSVMNYPLRRAVIDFFTHKACAQDVAALVLHQREVYPAPFLYSLMNLLGSHDRVRILNALAGYDREGAAQMPREEARGVRLTDEQLALSKARYLAALQLLCALPGAPTVYYGDEIGMQGMADPWNRAPMAWKHADAALCSGVGTLLNLRRSRRVLQVGLLDISAEDDDTLLIRRYAENGLDAFGQSLNEEDMTFRISRKVEATAAPASAKPRRRRKA